MNLRDNSDYQTPMAELEALLEQHALRTELREFVQETRSGVSQKLLDGCDVASAYASQRLDDAKAMIGNPTSV